MVTLEKMTITEVLKRSVNLFAGKVALSGIDGNAVSYNELNNKVEKISNFLKDQELLAEIELQY